MVFFIEVVPEDHVLTVVEAVIFLVLDNYTVIPVVPAHEVSFGEIWDSEYMMKKCPATPIDMYCQECRQNCCELVEHGSQLLTSFNCLGSVSDGFGLYQVGCQLLIVRGEYRRPPTV